MGDDTEIRSARRGLLLSVLLILVAACALTWSAWRYWPTLMQEEGGGAAGPPGDEKLKNLWAEEDAAPEAAFEDLYPIDTTPPAGTQYPCPFTPLPREMAGIPPSHRGYVSHVCSLVLKAIHIRLEAWEGLGPPQPPAGLLDRYLSETRYIVGKLKKEPTPKSMEESHKMLVEALELQMTFLQRGYEARASGQNYQQIADGIPEGKLASGKLMSVWGCWQMRYPNASPEVVDSLMHHFCALDFY